MTNENVKMSATGGWAYHIVKCLLLILLIIKFALLYLPTASSAQDILTPAYVEYTRAQEIHWLDCSDFVVGRWDSSIAIFRIPYAGENKPKMLQIRASSEGIGIEMAHALNEKVVLFSDGPGAIGVWSKNQGRSFSDFKRSRYNKAVGVANCAASMLRNNNFTVLTGHANGFVVVWKFRRGNLIPLRTIDLRSGDPVPSPYPLKNIRGLAFWKEDVVISASEDGDIVAFKPQDGSIIFRQRYNPSAQRGINSLSLMGDKLLVGNCSVGPTDKNIWLYDVSISGLRLVDSVNLKRNPDLPQVFAFNAKLYLKSGKLHFFASTQEGLLWSGSVDHDKLFVDGIGAIDNDGAASIDLNRCNDFLVAGAHQIYLFNLEKNKLLK